jgi:hypothetical protein
VLKQVIPVLYINRFVISDTLNLFVKAANPGSLLEDFVRWYSPRDWIEGDADEFEDEMISTTPTDGWELDEENPIITEDTKVCQTYCV